MIWSKQQKQAVVAGVNGLLNLSIEGTPSTQLLRAKPGINPLRLQLGDNPFCQQPVSKGKANEEGGELGH